MKIRYCGNFEPTYSTESHISATLEMMGHEVVRLQEDKTNDIVGDCDLFLFTRTWGNTVTLDHLRQYKEMMIPTVSYHLDLYVGLQRNGGIGSDPFWNTEYVFTADGDPESQKYFESLGINHYWLPPAVYEPECTLEDVPKTKELIFVGSYGYHPEYPYRPQLIDWLKGEYAGRFEHWGSEGMGHVRGAELNLLYASTKVVVGDSLLLPDHINYWSDRVPETLGRGGFLIHPKIKGMPYKDAVHLRYYEHGNFKQLKYLIDHYLKADEEREKIRKQGHEYVKKHQTYTNRLQEMLSVVGK